MTHDILILALGLNDLIVLRGRWGRRGRSGGSRPGYAQTPAHFASGPSGVRNYSGLGINGERRHTKLVPYTNYNDEIAAIRKLYPNMHGREAVAAQGVIDYYLTLVLRLHNRIMADPGAYAEFRRLTAVQKDASIDERHHSAGCGDRNIKT